jgi:hypothetical protein
MIYNHSYCLSKYSKALNKQFQLLEKEKESILKRINSDDIEFYNSKKLNHENKIEKKSKSRNQNTKTFMNMYK